MLDICCHFLPGIYPPKAVFVRKISFPEDSNGWKRQKDKLESEGVVFLKGKVNLEQFGYRGAVDRLLWGGDDL